MIDLEAAKRALAAAPPKGRAAVVSRTWLEDVVLDLSELAEIRKQKAQQS